MSLTRSKLSIRLELLNVSFDHDNFINIKERRRSWFSIIFPGYTMENDWKIFVRKPRRVKVRVGNSIISAGLKISAVEFLIRVFENGVMRSEILDQFHDAKQDLTITAGKRD